MSRKYRKSEKLELWQERLADSNRAYAPEVARMNKREKIYAGDRELRPLVVGDHHRDGRWKESSHVRNIVFENVESQVSSSIPQPKVTPKRKKDEHLADVIENFLRNELDRLPFERINDMAERTVPIQGGVGYLVEWDNESRTHDTVGEISVSVVHPKQFAPQPGVFTGIQDMDWFIIKTPTTKAAIKRKYGIDVTLESEAEPEVRGAVGVSTADDAVTQYIGFERNDMGGINRYSWVNDVELEDLENYQARRQPVCARCGRVRPLKGQVIGNGIGAVGPDGTLGPSAPPMRDDTEKHLGARAMARKLTGMMFGEPGTSQDSGMGGFGPEGTGQEVPRMMNAPGAGGSGPEGLPGLNLIGIERPEAPEPVTYDGGPCPWCGSKKFDSQEQEFEEVTLPIRTAGGMEIPGATPGLGAGGEPVMRPTLIPFYRPDQYPIILQRSVSMYGQLLGNSDVDVIEDQQNTTNRIEQKIIDRIMKAGTRITLPDNAMLRMDPEDGERWYIGNAADKQIIGVYDFKGDLSYEMAYLAEVYEEARQMLGITDSFQGRKDSTATSGKAKEFAAAQSAGRLESKRVMKDAAYAEIFERMFKLALAYSDEPRPVSYKNEKGETRYEEFNRYDFLEQDADGTWFWNDQFLFSCDTSAPLASNREAMWQETRMNLQTGAFGDPTQVQTLILFWSKMEMLHYPGAGETKKFLEEQLQQQMQAAQAQQIQMMQMQAAQAAQQQAQMAQGIPQGTLGPEAAMQSGPMGAPGMQAAPPQIGGGGLG